MSDIIKIHEFSTGIEIFGTAKNWSIGGFTGKYMNSTMPSMPPSVKDAIAGGYFKIAEGKSSSNPAVVGREISINLDRWSVVAVVTKGKEASGRTGSLYRYFLSEGLGNIRYILQWMYQKNRDIMTFDPFDIPENGSPHQYKIRSSKPIPFDKLKTLLYDPQPIIVPYNEECKPLVLNEMANALDEPIAWAFNVQGLEKPRSFQIIQPANHNSEETIRQIISKSPKERNFNGQENTAIVAIRNLTNSSTFKAQFLSSIENELSIQKFSEDDWEDIFNQLGAKQELKEKTYAPPMLRLLTLRAMILPGTLPEFLRWIGQTQNPKHYNISSDFQSEVFQYSRNYPIINLRARVIDGVKYIIANLVKDSEVLEPTVKLLTDEQGIWKYYYKKRVMPALDNDFKRIRKYYTYQAGDSDAPYEIFNHPCWQKIYDRLRNFWQPKAIRYQITEYQPIAELFYQTNKANKTRQELRLYALFQYVSQGIIPNSLFNKLKKNLTNPQIKRGLDINVYELWVKRRVPWYEKLYVAALQIAGWIFDRIRELWKLEVKFPFPMMMLFLGIYTAILLGLLSILNKNPISLVPEFNNNKNPEPKEARKNDTPKPALETPVSPRERQPDPRPTKNNVHNTENINIPNDKLQAAFDQFPKTKQVIKEEIYQPLVDEFKSTLDKSGQPNNTEAVEQEIKLAIRKTLDPDNKLDLQYGLAIDEQDRKKNGEEKYKQEAEKWIKAIYSYQDQKNNEHQNINVVGFLVPETGQTNKYLLEDVRKKYESRV